MTEQKYFGLTRTTDSDVDVSAGKIYRRTNLHRQCVHTDVPNGTWSDVWAYGDVLPVYPWPIVDDYFRIKAGGNANDDANGTGARSVQLTYLDSEGVPVTEVLQTAGAAASAATSKQGRRLIRARVYEAGSRDGGQEADILIEHVTSGDVLAEISLDAGISRISMYTIPLHCRGFLRKVNFHSTGTKLIDLKMWARQGAYNDAAPFGALRLLGEAQNVDSGEWVFTSPRPLEPLTDIWLEVRGGENSEQLFAFYDLDLDII